MYIGKDIGSVLYQYSPLCRKCNIFGHNVVKCNYCNSDLCLDLGSVYINSKNSNYICYKCRINLINESQLGNVCSFQIIL